MTDNHTKDVRVLVMAEPAYGAGFTDTATKYLGQSLLNAYYDASGAQIYPMHFIKSDATFPLKEYTRDFIDGPSLDYGARLEVNKSFNFKDASFPMLCQSGAIDWLTQSLTDAQTDNSYAMHVEVDGKIIESYGLVPKKYEFKMNNNDLHEETVDFMYYDSLETGITITGVGKLNTGATAYWWKDGWITLGGAEITGFKEMSLTIENTYDDSLGKAGNPLDPATKTRNVEVSLTYRGTTPDVKYDLLSESFTKYDVIIARSTALNNFSGTDMTVSESDNNTIPGEKGYFETKVTLKATTGSAFS